MLLLFNCHLQSLKHKDDEMGQMGQRVQMGQFDREKVMAGWGVDGFCLV